MADGKCQSLFFISLPDLQKLCAVKVTINPQLAVTEFRTSQRKMCRRLVFLDQEVIASPVPGTLNQISVIMTIPFYKSGKCQTYITKHRATMAVPERVIPAVFQTCLSYTLITKLAPKWNQAGNLLIQGKDFLSQNGKQNAVVMDINVSDTQLCISTEVCTIRLPPPKLEDFHISTNIIKKFVSDDSAIIQRYSILNNWCYVLPSMKMGQIISISHIIPSDSPFQSYNELQLYWKKLYGYSLPEDSQIYCNINFKLIGEQLFTYPVSCIRSQPVQFFPRVDLEGVLDAFVTDVKSIILHTCGFPLKITNKALYATKELTQASVQKVSSAPANLTGKRNCKVALTQTIPPKSMYSPSACTIENTHKMELEAKQPNAGSFTVLNLLTKGGNPGAPERKVYSKEQWKPAKESIQMLNSKESLKNSNNSTRTYSNKIIPIFKGKLLQMNKQTPKAINGKKRQNASQYSPKVMKASTAAQIAMFKSSPLQLIKPLHDASLNSITSRSVMQNQTGKNNVKSTKSTLKEKNESNRHLTNGVLTNKAVLSSNSSKIKPRRLNSSLTSATDQSTHHASAIHQHLNKSANLGTGHSALITGMKRTHLSISHSDVGGRNSTVFQNQIKSSAEEAMIVYRSSSSMHKRAKRNGEQKETIPSSNESLHFEDVDSCQIYSESGRCMTSVPNKNGKRQQEDGLSYSKLKRPRINKAPNSKKELYKTQKNFLASFPEQ